METEPGTVEKTLEPARAESSDFYDEYPLMDNDASEPLAVPQAGIAIPMAATPRFIRAVPEEAELLYLPPDSLFDDIVKSEADRVAYPENVRNRIVYDSVGDPFQADTSAFVPHQMFSQVGQDARSGAFVPCETLVLVAPQLVLGCLQFCAHRRPTLKALLLGGVPLRGCAVIIFNLG